MAVCVYKYILNIVEDESIRPVMEFTLKIAEKHMAKLQDYFTQEKFPLPQGFTEEDIKTLAQPGSVFKKEQEAWLNAPCL